MKEGQFKGTPSGCMVGITAKGKTFVRVSFATNFYGDVHRLNWTGWLTPKAMPYTMEQLFRIGLTSKSLKRLMSGAEGAECINTVDSVEVSVKKQLDEDGHVKTNEAGEPYFHINYVGSGAMESDEKALGALDKNALLSAMLKLEGRSQTAPKFDTNEVPF